MIGRTNVGGGAALNFKVVGGTGAPGNPKENTIWVNTDIPITHWSFSATRPDNLVKSYIVDDAVAQFQSCLFAEVDLKPNTTYTLAFEGIAGQKFYMNEKIAGWKPFDVEPYWNTVTFTTLSNLDKSVAGQYTPGYGWVLVKNNATLESAPAFRGLRIVEGDKDIEPAGSIWIQTGTSSTAPFNALKKNGITVYPLGAKQYVSGAWVDKTAKSYKNGEWVELIPEGMLYYRGNECDPVTGGWSAFVGYSSSYTLGSYTEGSDKITLKLNGNQKCVSAAPVNKIDLSKASTLIVNVTRVPTEATYGLYVTSVRNVNSCDRAVAQLEELTKGENVLDVSSLSGSYYIVLNIARWDSSTDRLEFDEVRYE